MLYRTSLYNKFSLTCGILRLSWPRFSKSCPNIISTPWIVSKPHKMHSSRFYQTLLVCFRYSRGLRRFPKYILSLQTWNSKGTFHLPFEGDVNVPIICRLNNYLLCPGFFVWIIFAVFELMETHILKKSALKLLFYVINVETAPTLQVNQVDAPRRINAHRP